MHPKLQVFMAAVVAVGLGILLLPNQAIEDDTEVEEEEQVQQTNPQNQMQTAAEQERNEEETLLGELLEALQNRDLPSPDDEAIVLVFRRILRCVDVERKQNVYAVIQMIIANDIHDEEEFNNFLDLLRDGLNSSSSAYISLQTLRNFSREMFVERRK